MWPTTKQKSQFTFACCFWGIFIYRQHNAARFVIIYSCSCRLRWKLRRKFETKEPRELKTMANGYIFLYPCWKRGGGKRRIIREHTTTAIIIKENHQIDRTFAYEIKWRTKRASFDCVWRMWKIPLNNDNVADVVAEIGNWKIDGKWKNHLLRNSARPASKAFNRIFSCSIQLSSTFFYTLSLPSTTVAFVHLKAHALRLVCLTRVCRELQGLTLQSKNVNANVIYAHLSLSNLLLYAIECVRFQFGKAINSAYTV